ncbi:MAG: MFS transporter [Balneolaceae bacterium]|jgi:MFS family permease
METEVITGEQNREIAEANTSYEITAVVLAFGSNFFAGIIATLMSTYLTSAVRELLGTLNLSQVSYVESYVSALFLLGWAAGGFALGWLGDYWGRVRVFSASIFIFSLFTMAISWVSSWYALVVFRFLTGIGVGATMVLSAVLIAEIWGERAKGRAIAISIVAVGFPIGIIVSGMISYLLPEWRTAFLVGLFPLVLALLCHLLLKESDQWKHYTEDKFLNKDRWSTFKDLLAPSNRANFIIGTTIFGAMLVGLWAVFSWLPTWAQSLVGTAKAGEQEGGILLMLLGIGGIIGCLIAGFLANIMGRRKALLLSFAGAFVSTSLLFWTNGSFGFIIYVETAILSLFFGISQGILTVYIPELYPTSIRSTATGIGFNAGRLFTAAAVFFVGILVPVLGGYGNALFVFSLTYAIGFVVTFFGKETKGSTL